MSKKILTGFIAAGAFMAFLLSMSPTALSYQPSLEEALEMLGDPSPIRRYEAIEYLGSMDSPEAIKILIELMADEDNSWIAVRQLVILKDRAEPYLLEALESQNPDIVKYAIYALGDLRCKKAARPIARFLDHPDPEIRRNAVFALGYVKDPSATEALFLKLSDPDNVVREYAAAALENIGDERAIPFLREALRNETGSVFNMATALYNLGGDDVIDILIRKLKDPNSTNRLYAVYALGKIKDIREVQPLIDVLSDNNVQWLAAKALINVGEMAVPSLIRGAGHRDRDIRLYSIYALGEIGDKKASQLLYEKILDPEPMVRDYAADALIKVNDHDIIPQLLDYLEKGDCYIQSEVLRVLGHMGDPMVVEHIYPLLKCDYSMVRKNAAYALGELQDYEAVEHLIRLLEDQDSGVSRATANALTKIGEGAIETLLERLPQEKGPAETWIIYILGKLEAKEAVDQLIKKLSSENYIVRRYATAALTEIGDPRVEEYLVTMLSDIDPYVRMYASFGLMDFGGRLSIKLLLNALKSEETRWLAIRILDRIGPRGVDELINALKDESIQWYAAETLIKLDGDILPQLEEGLRSDEEAIRNNIAMILGEVKDKRAVEPLLDALKDESRSVLLAASSLVNIGDPSVVDPLIECLNHQSDQVRMYAAYALGHLGNVKAVEPLVQCLRDPDPSIRGIAAYSLGLLRSRRATPPLIDKLTDPDRNVRFSAIYALGKIGDRRSLPYLKESYQKDPDYQVQQAAKGVMEEMLFVESR